ncbi:hypothetical protein [Flavivirga jejuensis]|uniref:Uncharacterized protein n=1 Tax=Flavivirga jejuensis TaxID=870487 RepID=A0ABT8WSZ1_9FLAO|nr:hypothetical protein [Flavivirga jejuensis]MDO5976089.1 hypothetical protein [Flavivirga jejuensis]
MENSSLFQEFGVLTELYKFYLDIVLKSVTFVLGVAGAVIAYLLKEAKTHLSAYGLFVPSILCLGMGGGFLLSLKKAKELSVAIDNLHYKLDLVLKPHTEVLESSLFWFGILLMALGFIILISIVPITRYLKKLNE